MKTFPRLMTLALVAAPSACGDGPTAAVSVPPAQVVTTPAPTPVTLPRIGPYKHSATIEEEEDRFTKVVTTRLTKVDVGNGLRMIFRLEQKRGEATPPTAITFRILSTSPGWRFRDDSRVVLLIDDKPLELGTATTEGNVLAGNVLEHADSALSLPDFARLVAAKTVEGRVGKTEFKLSADNLEALRDFASRIPGGTTADGKYVVRHE